MCFDLSKLEKFPLSERFLLVEETRGAAGGATDNGFPIFSFIIRNITTAETYGYLCGDISRFSGHVRAKNKGDYRTLNSFWYVLLCVTNSEDIIIVLFDVRGVK